MRTKQDTHTIKEPVAVHAIQWFIRKIGTPEEDLGSRPELALKDSQT